MNRISSSRIIDVCLLNVRSIKNKALIIKEFVVDNDIDILALTETWLNPGAINHSTINSICPTGYLFQHVSLEKRGGGVCILYKQPLKLKTKSLRPILYINHLKCRIKR
jgi:exonuclease III